MKERQGMKKDSMVWRTRWAALGAAVAVSLGGGGLFLAYSGTLAAPRTASVVCQSTSTSGNYYARSNTAVQVGTVTGSAADESLDLGTPD
jgi:hypothetical protein